MRMFFLLFSDFNDIMGKNQKIFQWESFWKDKEKTEEKVQKTLTAEKPQVPTGNAFSNRKHRGRKSHLENGRQEATQDGADGVLAAKKAASESVEREV